MQWFVNMKPLAEPAIAAVQDGKTKFVPDRLKKLYFNWMENIHDWCISRQLWWGHRIPAWYCEICGGSPWPRKPDACQNCGSATSARTKTCSTPGFPQPSGLSHPRLAGGYRDLRRSIRRVLVTAYDIIFFWVARMIFMGAGFQPARFRSIRS